jgi:hypothetical protein
MPRKADIKSHSPAEWKASIPGFVTVRLGNVGVLFAGTEPHRAIVVFFVDARIAVIKKSAGKVRMIAAVDGGRRCAGGPEQMGGDVYTDRFTSELRDQGAEVLGGQLPAGS